MHLHDALKQESEHEIMDPKNSISVNNMLNSGMNGPSACTKFTARKKIPNGSAWDTMRRRTAQGNHRSYFLRARVMLIFK